MERQAWQRYTSTRGSTVTEKGQRCLHASQVFLQPTQTHPTGPSAGPWAVTVYSFGCCLSIRVSHNLSFIIRVTKAWKSRILQRVLEFRLEDSLWIWDFLLPPLLGAKAESQAEALRTSYLSLVSSKNVFLMPR